MFGIGFELFVAAALGTCCFGGLIALVAVIIFTSRKK